MNFWRHFSVIFVEWQQNVKKWEKKKTKSVFYVGSTFRKCGILVIFMKTIVRFINFSLQATLPPLGIQIEFFKYAYSMLRGALFVVGLLGYCPRTSLSLLNNYNKDSSLIILGILRRSHYNRNINKVNKKKSVNILVIVFLGQITKMAE